MNLHIISIRKKEDRFQMTVMDSYDKKIYVVATDGLERTRGRDLDILSQIERQVEKNKKQYGEGLVFSIKKDYKEEDK